MIKTVDDVEDAFKDGKISILVQLLEPRALRFRSWLCF